MEKSGLSAHYWSVVGTEVRSPSFLYPYQKDWIPDDSRLKIATKARRIGYSFAAGYRLVRKCLNASASACYGMLKRVCAGRFHLVRGS